MSTEVIPSEAENITEAMVPYFPEDSKKSKYISYRVSGFTVREALHLTGIHERSVQRWRKSDPKFLELESTGISELRKGLSNHYVQLQYTRNMHLVLQKDYTILAKSITKPDDLTKAEHEYLLKLRTFYTPQQLALIKEVVSDTTNSENFTDIVFRISREREELTIAKRTTSAD